MPEDALIPACTMQFRGGTAKAQACLYSGQGVTVLVECVPTVISKALVQSRMYEGWWMINPVKGFHSAVA